MMQALGSMVLAGLNQRGEAMDRSEAEAIACQQAAAYWADRAQREMSRAEARKAVGLDCETALVCALLAQRNAAGYSKRTLTLLGVVQ